MLLIRASSCPKHGGLLTYVGSHRRCLTAQVCQKDFPLTDDYTAPKGSLLMPSLIAASMQARMLRTYCSPHKRPTPMSLHPFRAAQDVCALSAW